MDQYVVFWLGLTAVFLLVEIATVSVVSIWFVMGALGAAAVAALEGELWLQCMAFLALSVVLLLSLRPILRKFFKPKLTATNVDAVIGTEGIVTEPVDNLKGTGRIKLGAMDWAARSTNGQTIREGTLARVDKVEGVKVFLTPVVKQEEVTL